MCMRSVFVLSYRCKSEWFYFNRICGKFGNVVLNKPYVFYSIDLNKE